MIFGGGKSGQSCYKCKEAREWKRFELPGIRFNWLEGDIWICEKCFAESLGVTSNWIEAVINEQKQK